jgi:hypothetical protein
MHKFSVLVFLLFFAILSPSPAHAYLDPGTGSLVFQIVIGFVLGGLFTFRTYFSKIKALIVKIVEKMKNGKSNPNKK